MKTKSIKALTLIIMLSLFSCKTVTIVKQENVIENNSNKDLLISKEEKKSDDIVLDNSPKGKIAQFLRVYLNEDLPFMSDDDRMFCFQAVDLNADKRDEYLVTIIGSYFCGTGGCNLYVLNYDFTINTDMSVVSFPIYVSKTKNKGWNDLLIHSDWRICGDNPHRIKYNGITYPQNPSLEPCNATATLQDNALMEVFADEDLDLKYKF